MAVGPGETATYGEGEEDVSMVMLVDVVFLFASNV